MTNLMIVKSAAKAKKIAEWLGEGWRVETCMGHVRDLPGRALGVEVGREFQPTYEIVRKRTNLVRRLIKAMRDADAVYIATDPDREGEAIAWHVLEVATLPADKPIFRAAFNAITADAVRQAVDHPRPLDVNLIEAQQARRIVDRLVGYLASPLAAKALDAQVSAGRVQSVCLRLLVERERAIQAFQLEPFWSFTMKLSADGVPFSADLVFVKGVDLPFKESDLPNRIAALLKAAHIWVQQVSHVETSRAPLPPFTTASLQQSAAHALGLSPERTMTLAQRLYEAGWITYVRTDGVTVAPEAQAAARALIAREHGAAYVPDVPPIYTAKARHAQEAHEAIRPTDVERLPREVDGDSAALYRLIWRRFIASQMTPARYQRIGAQIQAGKLKDHPYPLEFRAQSRALRFDGFLKVSADLPDDGAETPETLPPLHDGQALTLIGVEINEGHTRAPAPFTEAALIEALETHGVGRPSTYATILRTVKEKGYVRTEEKRLIPTERGIALSDFLTMHFGDVLAVEFTAHLETALDRVALGEQSRLELLRDFWRVFQPRLQTAAETLRVNRAAKPLILKPTEGIVHDEPA